MRVRRTTEDASRSELSQQLHCVGHSSTDIDSWGRCVTHTASHQTRRYAMMVFLTVWGAALAGFVAGAAWNGRVRS